MHQRGVGHKIYTLNQALDMQMAEAHLSDFVQRSSDLLVVVKDCQRYSFVSSASQTLLHVSPDALLRQSVTTLLGPANAKRIRRFLEAIATGHLVNAEMEAVIVGPSGEQQVLRIVGTDQSLNPAIAGIALTVRDVTEQRQLEREALETAAREQERVSYDLHEGLSQDLTGIALLLKSLNLASGREARLLVGVLDATIEHVNHALDSTRRMATTLSPVRVSRGSLDVALDRLAQNAREHYTVRVIVSTLYNKRAVGESDATQLYRIAQEGIDYVGRNSGCTIVDVSLSTLEDELILSILGRLSFCSSGNQAWRQSSNEQLSCESIGRHVARGIGNTGWYTTHRDRAVCGAADICLEHNIFGKEGARLLADGREFNGPFRTCGYLFVRNDLELCVGKLKRSRDIGCRGLFGHDGDTGLDRAEQHDRAVGLIGIIHCRLTSEGKGIVTRRQERELIIVRRR
jgi:PAS domain S-box-containing protein